MVKIYGAHKNIVEAIKLFILDTLATRNNYSGVVFHQGISNQ